MKKSVLFKLISLILILSLFGGLLTACGKPASTSSVQESSSDTSVGTSSTSSLNQILGSGGGSKPVLDNAFAFYDGNYPTIQWHNLEGREGWSAKVVIKDLNGKTVFEESDIKTNSYTLKKQLTNNQEYRLLVYYSNADGSSTGLFGGIYGEGLKIIYQKRDSSKSKYYFDGGISLDTLNNYLNRTMTFCQVFQPEDDFEMIKESIVGAGAKYIQRAACIWAPSNWEYNIKKDIRQRIDGLHDLDPEIIFEACIFECISKSVEQISIPAETFEVFGLTPEKRNFDFEKMVFPNGYGKDQWGAGTAIPDITQLETQMFFYHRAQFYIDLGFEALHLGQASLIGKNDTDNKCWTKVISLIREYAEKNARRHYVILDAHYPSHYFTGTDGNMLTDFNAFPMRISVAPGQTDHKASESAPQECVITPGSGDAVYQRGIRGTSPSGWYTNKYPYLVEVDNWGIQSTGLDRISSYIWGYDEITWFANQPQWYRQKFVEDLTKQIDSFNENGHLAVVGKRWISKIPGGNGSNCYYAASKAGDVNFYGDLEFYKNLWKKLNK